MTSIHKYLSLESEDEDEEVENHMGRSSRSRLLKDSFSAARAAVQQNIIDLTGSDNEEEQAEEEEDKEAEDDRN